MKEFIVRWISILLFLAISILLIKVFLWLLPILLGLVIGYYIYCYFKSKYHNNDDVVIEKGSKNKSHKKKNKKIVIIDEEK